MLNNTADPLLNHLTSLVPVKVSWFGILALQTIATWMSLVIAWWVFQHYDFMSSTSFLVLTSKLEPSTGFTSIFGFANRNLLQVFTSILALPIRTWYRFSPAFWLCQSEPITGFHQHFSTANCTVAVQHGWQTAFKLMVLLQRAVVENFILHFLISVFKSFVSGPDSCEEQFRLMDFISPQEFQRGLTGFTLHKTTMAAVFFQLSSYYW